MKKIIIFITLLIFIPFFIVIIYNKNYKEIKKIEYIEESKALPLFWVISL